MAGSVFRVFVSSTFRDMHAERDYLNRVVFPELRGRLAARGVELVAVDLRWGLTEEQARASGALNLCLREIDECQVFLCLLGDRYGWAPPPDEIPAGLFEQARASTRLPLDEWYELHEASVPPAYRPRAGLQPPPPLVPHLVSLFEGLGLPGAGQSITEREVGRALARPGRWPSHCFFHERAAGLHEGPHFPPELVPVFSEVEAGPRDRLRRLKERVRGVGVSEYRPAFAGLRIDPALLPQGLPASDALVLGRGAVGPAELAALGQAARRALAEHGTVALAGLEQFGERVMQQITAALGGQARAASPGPADDHHERFLLRRTRLFEGRDDALGRLLDYAAEAPPVGPLLVTGPAGCGKSTLLARFVELCRQRQPGALVVPYFVGGAPDSARLPVLLGSLLEALRRGAGLPDEVPEDELQRRGLLRPLLARAAARHPVVLVLDALNQLDGIDPARDLAWFPAHLPPNVRLVASAGPGPWADALAGYAGPGGVLPLGPLGRRALEATARQYLALRRKQLAPAQLEALLDADARPAVGLPLYLTVALEELCLFGSHEALGRRIAHLPPSVPELFAQVLARLEQDHGEGLVRSVCGWLAASRSGLTEPEALALLARHAGAPPPAHWRRLYRALQAFLRPMDEGGPASGLIAFFHEQLRLAVLRRHLGMGEASAAPSPAYRRAHAELAGLFQVAAKEGGKWRVGRPRALAELPHHLARAALYEGLGGALCDVRYIAARAEAGPLHALNADYAEALSSFASVRAEQRAELEHQQRRREYARALVDSARAAALGQKAPQLEPPPSSAAFEEMRRADEAGAPGDDLLARLRAFAVFVSSHDDALTRFPDQAAFFARNSAADGPVAAAAGPLVEKEGRPWLARQARRPAPPHGPLVRRVLVGHAKDVADVAITPDGCLAASGGADGVLNIWDVATGQRLHRLQVPGEKATAVALSADGRLAASGMAEGAVLVWDVATGARLHSLAGGKGRVGALDFTPDGRLLVSCTLFGDCRVWDVATGNCLLRLKEAGENEANRAVAAFSHDGSRVVVAAAGPLEAWSLSDPIAGPRKWEGGLGVSPSAGFVAVWRKGDPPMIEAHGLEDGVPTGGGARCTKANEVALSPDGRLLAARGEGVALWDMRTGEQLRRLPRLEPRGNTHPPHFLALSADGRVGVACRTDRFVRVLDLARGASLAYEGAEEEVVALALTPDGRFIVSASEWDGLLQLWDAASGRCLRAEKVEGGVGLTPDGRFAVTAEHVFDVTAWRAVRRLTPTDATPSAFAVSADARLAVSITTTLGHMERQVPVIWDLTTGMPVRGLLGHQHMVTAAALTPDGRFAATGSLDETVRMWDVAAGRPLATFEGAGEWITALAITPDGRLVAAETEGHVVSVWQVAGKQRVCALAGHRGRVGAASFHPGGRYLATGGDDQTVCLWEVPGGRCVAAHQAGSAVTALGPVAPDGRFAYGCLDGEVAVLNARNLGLAALPASRLAS